MRGTNSDSSAVTATISNIGTTGELKPLFRLLKQIHEHDARNLPHQQNNTQRRALLNGVSDLGPVLEQDWRDPHDGEARQRRDAQRQYKLMHERKAQISGNQQNDGAHKKRDAHPALVGREQLARLAPTTPATTNTAPMMPASAEVMPCGGRINSSTVSTVLKMPIDTKQTSNTSKYARFLNSFLIDAALKSSLIAAGPGGGRRGFFARQHNAQHGAYHGDGRKHPQGVGDAVLCRQHR